MTEAHAKTKADGRVQRSRDSRARIIQALFDYCDRGILVPTAQEVADAAGVSLRTVFRHFSDMESLFIEMDRQIYERFTPLFTQPITDGALDQRIEDMVARRAKFYEECGPYIRSTQAQSWRYELMSKSYGRKVEIMRKDLLRWLPELNSAAPQAALHAELAVSFEVWDRLRRHNNVSRDAAQNQVVSMVKQALGRP